MVYEKAFIFAFSHFRHQLWKLLRQRFGHSLVLLVGSMDIGVGGKCVITMAQPGLDIFHGIPQVEHDGSAAVPQIVEPNGTQFVLLQELLEFLTYIIRLQNRPHLIHTDKIQITLIIGGTTYLHLTQLLIAQIQKILVGIGAERKIPAAVFRLGGVLPNCGYHIVSNLFLHDGGINMNPSSLQVNG